MKFNCDALGDWLNDIELSAELAKQKKKEALKKWHPWFAWYPVRVQHGDCRWLEVVSRKGNVRREWGVFTGYYDDWTWQYLSVEMHKERNECS